MTTTTAPYTKEQAKAHDALLAEATTELRAASDRLDSAHNSGHRAAGDRTGYRHGQRHATWGMSEAEVSERLDELAGGTGPAATAAQRALAAIADAERAQTEARAEVLRLDDVWRERGMWSRFFMVTGGHIHSSTGCHTLRPTTWISWLPELSAESEAEAVTAHGSVLCTHCFPSAPVEWTTKAPKPVDPNLCGGTGKYVPDANLRLCSPRGTCPECGKTVSVTSRANARKHEPLAKPQSEETCQ